MQQQLPDVSERWMRRDRKTTPSWICVHCPDRKIFNSEDDLWVHAMVDHSKDIPQDHEERLTFRRKLVAESSQGYGYQSHPITSHNTRYFSHTILTQDYQNDKRAFSPTTAISRRRSSSMATSSFTQATS
jgi:hypothetical protein